MPIALFEKIVKDLCEERNNKGLVSPAFNFIYTAHYNEILLYRHIAEMFEVLRKHGLRTIVLTNGIALTPRKADLIARYDDVVGAQVCVNISAFERDRWIANTIAGNGASPDTMRRTFNRTMKNLEYASSRLRGVSIQVNETDPQQAARQVDAIRAQTTAQLAFHAAEMVTFSAQVQAVRDEVRQALGAARDQDEARTREGSVLKGDLQRFSDWVEAGQARQAAGSGVLQSDTDLEHPRQIQPDRQH